MTVTDDATPQSPTRERPAPRAELTIQEETCSRTSSSNAEDGAANSARIMSPIQQRWGRVGAQKGLGVSVPAFIKRTGSGVRSDQGAVDTPISSPLSSPRGRRGSFTDLQVSFCFCFDGSGRGSGVRVPGRMCFFCELGGLRRCLGFRVYGELGGLKRCLGFRVYGL